MKVHETAIPGLLLIEPKVYVDHRGFFLETYNRARYREAGVDAEFVQDNQSKSQRGTLRGLHFQVHRPQAKLIWALAGEIWDVAVDMRPDSLTRLQWVGVKLTSETKQQLYIPRGFAHGFFVLSETAEIAYKCDQHYDPKDESGLRWDDPLLGIDWPLGQVAPILNARDDGWPLLGPSLPPLETTKV